MAFTHVASRRPNAVMPSRGILSEISGTSDPDDNKGQGWSSSQGTLMENNAGDKTAEPAIRLLENTL